jgi:hypothetical protein
MPMLDLFLVEHDWLFVAAAHETDCINHPTSRMFILARLCVFRCLAADLSLCVVIVAARLLQQLLMVGEI